MKKFSKETRSFTLIELLVVISVLGILFAVLLPNLLGVRLRGRDVSRKNDAAAVKQALRLYYNDYQHYPAASGTSIAGCGTGTTVCPNTDGSFADTSTIYMKEMPTDFSYSRPTLDSFLLSVPLENASDPDIAASAKRCNVATPGTNYYVCEE